MMKNENILLDSSSEALWDAPIPHLTQWNTDQDLQVEKKWTENIENN